MKFEVGLWPDSVSCKTSHALLDRLPCPTHIVLVSTAIQKIFIIFCLHCKVSFVLPSSKIHGSSKVVRGFEDLNFS